MFRKINNIHVEYFHVQYTSKYFVEYFQSRKTLLWIWIMLCLQAPNMIYFLNGVSMRIILGKSSWNYVLAKWSHLLHPYQFLLVVQLDRRCTCISLYYNLRLYVHPTRVLALTCNLYPPTHPPPLWVNMERKEKRKNLGNDKWFCLKPIYLYVKSLKEGQNRGFESSCTII